MELSDLRIFAAVARAGGITRAAAELHTVQSSVSARVAGLERELGAALLRRHARGVALTPAGEQFLDHARRIIALADEAVRIVRDETPRGPLRIGAMETTAGIRLPPVLEAYTAAWPEVDLSVLTGPTDSMVAQVKDHALDGALVAGPVGDQELHEEEIFTEELAVVTAVRHRDLDEALHTPRLLVFRAGCSYRRRLESVARARGVEPKILEYGSAEGILGCVAAGLGITMLPRELVERSGLRHRLRLHSSTPVPTVFIRRHDAHATTALKEFARHLRETREPESPHIAS
ncbi:DNA-binding transcriptional regulator, LysR family [Saccharopolyspora antimicrobica]|uniref:DNA-binding transcriptional LysR family regulator n=1 Tax=Saccharopolyspora antimicrobica TaxID=455193 RepID=A0A1I5CB15_9PSEU|nr:LysR family transcriptional regulator [Saccharopolyspora antimicrobica]RKT88921.1 DNA-binding transcriptional LysR family regulator [Saccharopolyspora antimicrobica]SFN83831.1 DNA-binding transcriptional regulator, LysR family [Saccharopolyspora antimicrobica]